MNPTYPTPFTPDPLVVEISDDEILADLSWPGPPPGRWLVPTARIGNVEHVDTLLERLEDAA